MHGYNVRKYTRAIESTCYLSKQVVAKISYYE